MVDGIGIKNPERRIIKILFIINPLFRGDSILYFKK